MNPASKRRVAMRLLARNVTLAATMGVACWGMAAQRIEAQHNDRDRREPERRDDRDQHAGERRREDERRHEDERRARERELLRLPRLTGISPAAARAGDLVTISDREFCQLHVRITIRGVPAQIVVAIGNNRVTFVVPAGVPAGSTVVVVTTLQGRSASIGFEVLDGRLLPGNPNAAATSAVTNLLAVAATESDIQAGVILTRLEADIAADATVAQVNAALVRVRGGIVSMLAGSLGLTIGVPRQANLADLQALANILGGMPGIHFAGLSHVANPDALFPSTDVGAARHLVPTKFPAAWNAHALLNGCQSHPVPVLIPDYYGPRPLAFDAVFPGFGDLTNGVQSSIVHGYNMMAILAAPGESSPTAGANPFFDCLSLRPIQIANKNNYGVQDELVLSFPPGEKFIVNFSLGSQSSCEDDTGAVVDCTPALVDVIETPLQRARTAVRWKQISRSRWSDFLVAAAAGNARDEGLSGAGIYPGLGRAANENEMAVASQPDPFFGFAQDADQWAPNAFFAELNFPSLQASDAEMGLLQQDILLAGLNTAVADNVVVVGSTTTLDPATVPQNSPGFDELSESSFSNSDPDVRAVGERVSNVCLAVPCPARSGTSDAAPQVAGLASYLWLLSPDLRARPSSVTKQAIVMNTRDGQHANRLLDAYATVLSLDAATLPDATSAPVRRAILDANDDGVFDERDLAPFVGHYFVLNPNGKVNFVPGANGRLVPQDVLPAIADFSRYDLNGDGFTGGLNTDRFDLDRVGSTQYGATRYTTVQQDIEGQAVSFPEDDLTDAQILCYYAYSDVYTGSSDARSDLLAGLCGAHVTVSVTPAAVTLAGGATQQFVATVHGTADPLVTWSVSGGGTISQTGLFTAGNAAGIFTARATSVADPTAVGEATVTVQISAGVQSSVFIGTGGNVPPGQIRAILSGTGFDLTVPIADVGTLMAQVNRALSGVDVLTVDVEVLDPVTLNVAFGEVGGLAVRAGCGSTVTVSAGNVRQHLDFLGISTSSGVVQIIACNSNVRVDVGDVDDYVAVFQSESSTINVTTGSISGVLIGNGFGLQNHLVNVNVAPAVVRLGSSIMQNVGCTVAITGVQPSIGVDSNQDLSLQTGDVSGLVTMTRNTMPRGLAPIVIGNIGGDLTITANHGFSNSDAQAFANAHHVAGTVTISGNAR